MSLRLSIILVATAFAVAACVSPGASPSPVRTPTAAPPSPTVAPATPTAVADACAGELPLKNPGRLTLSTDIPAFPPWWGGEATEQFPNEPEGGSPWTTDAEFSAEPYSMEGFEGATAYAIAEAMGFGPEEVDWVANPVFAQAFAPGEKPFDFHMAQVSITEDRDQAIDFSDPYFDSNQSLLALTPNEITSATSVEDLKGYRLGAAENTTSFELIEDVIQPDVEPSVFPTNADALAGLEGDTVDAIVVDLSTAFFMRDAELEDFDTDEPEGTIVGQFGPPVEADHVGAVLEDGSGLTPCVNQAIAQIKADGTHEAILDEWINTGQDIPFFE